jgi:chromosome partitioning protein
MTQTSDNKYVITIAARKGGVGKTTVACGLASIMATDGRRVVLVDLDPQSNAAYVLGVDPTAAGTAAWLTGSEPIFQPAADNLMVLAGGPELSERAIERLDPHDLHSAVKLLAADVVICDCPPGDENLERLAIRAASIALIVTDAHPLAVKGAGRVLEDLDADRRKGHRVPDRVALVLSKVDIRRSMDRGLDAHLESSWPHLHRVTVRQDIEVAAATATGTPLMQGAPNSRGAQDLQTLVRWIYEQQT